MINVNSREERVLARARQALAPTAEDERRVLMGLAASLHSPASPDNSLPPVPGSAAGHGRRYLFLAGGALALVVAAAGGYGWGYRTGFSARPAGLAAAAPAASRPPPAPAPLRSSLPPGVGTANVAIAPSARVRGATRLPTAPSATPPERPAGLDEEVRQLRRIERAIRDDNPRLALVIAEELDRSVPSGQLQLERGAAVLMASCQLGVEDASNRASRFLAEHPGNAYQARLLELCGLHDDQRMGEPAGTHTPKER